MLVKTNTLLVMKFLKFMKFASFSVVILTHQKPDSYSALASILVRVDQSDGNNYRLTGRPIPDY